MQESPLLPDDEYCEIIGGEYLTAETDPVLAELWDNEDDAVYDDLGGPDTSMTSSGPSSGGR